MSDCYYFQQLNVHYTFSITSLARRIGLATLLTADTAPLDNVRPSITRASISTSPFRFNTEPRPEITQTLTQLHFFKNLILSGSSEKHFYFQWEITSL